MLAMGVAALFAQRFVAARKSAFELLRETPFVAAQEPLEETPKHAEAFQRFVHPSVALAEATGGGVAMTGRRDGKVSMSRDFFGRPNGRWSKGVNGRRSQVLTSSCQELIANIWICFKIGGRQKCGFPFWFPLKPSKKGTLENCRNIILKELMASSFSALKQKPNLDLGQPPKEQDSGCWL